MLNAHVLEAIRRLESPISFGHDRGFPGRGSSTSLRIVAARTGAQYVVKCRAFAPRDHAYVCANEWVAGLLALQCSLPSLPIVAVQHPVGLGVGWPRISDEAWLDLGVHPQVLDLAVNVDMLHDMLVFDALIRNTDRNVRNVVAVRQAPGSMRCTLLVYDHDRSLVYPGTRPDDLDQPMEHLNDPLLWNRVPAVLSRITRYERVEAAAARFQDVCPDEDIEAIVRSTPPEWLARAEAEPLIGFLERRRNRLGALVYEKARRMLPNCW